MTQMIESETAAEVAADDPARPAGPVEHDENIVEVLAAKVLIDWLRNRQQLLVPFRIDLQKLDAAQVSLLLHALIHAAQADGASDGKDRVHAALVPLNAADDQRSLVDGTLGNPGTLAQTLAEAKDVQTGAMVYAASLLALDRRKLVNRQYLRYLAARLQLPKDLTRSLEQRFYLAVE
jgi:uncharacterized membrane protein YebE (DUF533 family)